MMKTSDLEFYHPVIPRMITKWLYAKEIPFLKAEKERLSIKGWTTEVRSKQKNDGTVMYALIVLDEKLPIE
mgnify:CR=1 FL=1